MGKEINKEHNNFVQEYGRSWNEIVVNRFFIILTCTLVFTFSLIIFIANKDYSKSNKILMEQITRKYLQTLFSEVTIGTPSESIDSSLFYSKIDSESPSDTASAKSSGPISVSLADAGSSSDLTGLNLSDVNLPEALVAVKNISNTESYVRPIQSGKNIALDLSDSKPFDPWSDPIQRQGNITIEPIDQIVRGSQIVRGWRNPDEITFAIQKKETMIEHCFKREAKYYTDLSGYVIVRFIIFHTGIVDPASVKIIKSTLFNKKIELCIKKRLQSWRGFEVLGASMGSVAVMQKFIFD